ncbi:F-box domain [Dillenia turbinata]|uniref:F-box domain n=1 Tax=Dillenia turbinata TaxID=194707 RepID=A0AAN8V1Q7_9MAGN
MGEVGGMLERYEKLGLRESLHRSQLYPWACNELSFILRNAYSKLPKPLQSLIFQDSLSAFRLLPLMQTLSAASAANVLLQSAEAALPKQKRNLAMTEFKQAKVAYKRRYKSQQANEGSAQLPQDVLVHIFSFLDMHSLISVGLVCWSWNLAASDNHLWQMQYASFFGLLNNGTKIKGHKGILIEEVEVGTTNTNWREAFKKAYTGCFRRITLNRGFCGRCDAIVWLNNMKCANVHSDSKPESQQVRPVSPQQIVQFLLEDALPIISSSDSDSDSDGGSTFKLWAFPLRISKSCKRPHSCV